MWGYRPPHRGSTACPRPGVRAGPGVRDRVLAGLWVLVQALLTGPLPRPSLQTGDRLGGDMTCSERDEPQGPRQGLEGRAAPLCPGAAPCRGWDGGGAWFADFLSVLRTMGLHSTAWVGGGTSFPVHTSESKGQPHPCPPSSAVGWCWLCSRTSQGLVSMATASSSGILPQGLPPRGRGPPCCLLASGVLLWAALARRGRGSSSSGADKSIAEGSSRGRGWG